MKQHQSRGRRTTTSSDAVIRTKWKESRSLCGPYPTVHKCFFKMETLINAVEKGIREQDRFIYAGLQDALGRAFLSSVESDLVYEDARRLVFALSVASRTRKRAALRLVVARNHEECSAALHSEFEALTRLYQRAPEHVIPLRQPGNIFLPDRHRRKEVNREVFAYITDGPIYAAPLYVASPTQLGPCGPQPKRFSVKETEQLKADLIRLVARCYDERFGTGVDVARLTADCLAYHKQPNGTPGVLLLQCDRIRKRMRPYAVIRSLLFGVFEARDAVFPIAPARPDHFMDALSAAVSPETALAWCTAFFSRRSGGAAEMRVDPDSAGPGREYLEALEALSIP